MTVLVLSALSVCLFATSAGGCTQTPGLCPQSLGSLCSPHGCSHALRSEREGRALVMFLWAAAAHRVQD